MRSDFWYFTPIQFRSSTDPVFKQALVGWDVLGVFSTAGSYKKNFYSSKRVLSRDYDKFEYVGLIQDRSVYLVGRRRVPISRTFIPHLRRSREILLRSKPQVKTYKYFTNKESWYSGDTFLYSTTSQSPICIEEVTVSNDPAPKAFLPGTKILKSKNYSRFASVDTHTILSLKPFGKGYRKEVLTSSYDYLPALPTPNVSDVRNIAVVRCLNSIKDMDVNLGAAIGEGKQTLSLLLTSTRRIATSLSALHRGDFPTAIKALGLSSSDLKRVSNLRSSSGMRPSVSSLWLELQYGWLPLLGDIHGVIKTLEKAPRLGVVKFRGSAKEQVDRTYSLSATGWGALVPTIALSATSRAKCVVVCELENPLLATLSSVGLTNPLSVAWELTPFSFIVDWFLPIGKFIDILDAGVGWKFLDGTTSTRLVSTAQVTFSSSAVTVSPHQPAERQVVSKLRTVLPNFPKPTSIKFKDPRSTAHYLNSAALIRQFTKKG